MPIVDVEIVGDFNEPEASLSRSLADRLAEVFGSPPGQTWVRLRNLPLNCYAENGESEPHGANAVFVTVIKGALDEPQRRELEASRIAQVVAAVCSRSPERVHVLFEPPGAGRIAFGGKLMQ